jgi:UDP-N-acetylglucosamine acyltransferase
MKSIKGVCSGITDASRIAISYPKTKVGANTFIHPTAIIADNVVIGDNCYIGPYCLIGEPAEWKGRENESKGVIICNNVRITGHVTIDSGVEDKTRIGDNCYIMKGVHIGHDVYIENSCTISCHALIGGHVFIERDTNIGLGAIVHQKVQIPKECMIGMGTVVTKKTEMQSYSKYVGNPARYLSPNIKP